MTPDRSDDILLLEILHPRDNDGLSASQIGKRIGASRSAVLGKVNRVDRAYDEIDCTCEKPENRDGGMPPRWWADGVGA